MFIILARRTTATITTITTVIVVAWGLCSTIAIPLWLESPRITKMLFIWSLATIITTTGHTRRSLFLVTMIMFTSDVHPTITITTTITTTMGTRKWLFLGTMTTFMLIALPMDAAVLKTRRSLRLVTTAMIVFNGQCSLQANKVNRTWCHVSQSAPQRKSCSTWESGLVV
jgi:hypothetical protein